MTSEQLRAMHPAEFISSNNIICSVTGLLRQYLSKYFLTNYEKELEAEHGFVVTSRLAQ